MQRGIIQLSQTEQSILYAIIQSTPLRDSLIATRLSATSPEAEAETIEMSKDEAESLLDALPIPSQIEPQEITRVRQKLDTFIQNL